MAMTDVTAKCVKTTTPFTDKTKTVKLYVCYRTEQDVNANKSTIYCGMYVVTPGGWDIGPWGDYGGSYIGKTSLTFDGAISNFSGTKWLVENKSFTVSHNSDGTGTATIYWKWGVNSSWGGMTKPSGSFTITLPTIPRSSTITSASNITLGNPCSIKWTPASLNFKYKLKFSLGSWNDTTDFISPATTNEYTYTGYKIDGTTTQNSTTIYKQLPSATSGTMTATLTTYNSSGTQIGSSSSKTFTVTIPTSVEPSLGTVSLDPSNITTTDNVSRNILVKGKNTIKVSVSGAQAGAGSSIKSYTYNVLSGSTIIATTTTTSTSASFGPFQQTGDLKFRVTVTDNRNRSTSNKDSEPEWECYDYSAPSFLSFNAYRCDSSGNTDDNGKYIKYNLEVAYSSVNSTNKATVQIYYKKSTATSWTAAKDALTSSTTKSTSAIIKNTSGTNITFDTSSTYMVYATVIDNYNGSVKSSSATVFGASRIVNVRKNGSGIAFGKMAETDNLFECKWAAKFDGAVTVPDDGGPIINGYNVETLGPGKTIPSNEDLNNYVTPGVYKSDSGTVSGTLTNTPHTATGFKLKVEYLGASSYLRQTILPRTTCNYYVRYCTNGTWGNWQKFSGSDGGSYLSLSGGTLTGKLTLPPNLYYATNDTAGLDCSNSDIINANGIYFKDAVDSAGEGINFYRGSDTWDRLYSYNGTLYYIPNFGSSVTHDNVTKYKVYHSGIACTRLYNGTLTSGSITFNYGNYKAYVIVGQAGSGMARLSTYIPKSVLTTAETSYQIADETCYCSFYLSYSGSTVTLAYKDSNKSGRILYVYGIN